MIRFIVLRMCTCDPLRRQKPPDYHQLLKEVLCDTLCPRWGKALGVAPVLSLSFWVGLLTLAKGSSLWSTDKNIQSKADIPHEMYGSSHSAVPSPLIVPSRSTSVSSSWPGHKKLPGPSSSVLPSQDWLGWDLHQGASTSPTRQVQAGRGKLARAHDSGSCSSAHFTVVQFCILAALRIATQHTTPLLSTHNYRVFIFTAVQPTPQSILEHFHQYEHKPCTHWQWPPESQRKAITNLLSASTDLPTWTLILSMDKMTTIYFKDPNWLYLPP